MNNNNTYLTLYVWKWLRIDMFMQRSDSQFEYTSNLNQFDTLYCQTLVDFIHMLILSKFQVQFNISVGESEWSKPPG